MSEIPEHAAEEVADWLCEEQHAITSAFESIDGTAFREDAWERPEGGGGRTRVLEGGAVFERAGVNFSDVRGASLPAAASARRPELAGRSFRAMGVSVVVHPTNPYVPTSHLNVRFFVATASDAPAVWWFGGGFDLTPFYPFEEDCLAWHRAAREACDPFGSDLYPRFKAWCDEYFFIRHRNEPRGIGGIFFDDFNELPFAEAAAFTRGVARAYREAYAAIVAKRKEAPYGARERQWQLVRRGRYVEFNLVYDRGTLFGLQSNGRTESILVSMPPLVTWAYDVTPEPGSAEARLGEEFLVGREWLDE